MRIAVCVITFRRCAELRRLLDSIAGLHLQKTAPEMAVWIIDNDPNGSARGVMDGLATTFPFELIYDIEPMRGISSARNRAVASPGPLTSWLSSMTMKRSAPTGWSSC